MPKPFTPSSASAGNGPLTRNYANGETKQLVFSPNDIAVRYSWKLYLAILFFVVFFCMIMIIPSIAERTIVWPAVVIGCLFELIPVAIFVSCLLKMRKLPVFDTLNGMFYPQGRRHAESAISLKNFKYLEIIEIPMYRGTCFELNAVMQDGSRMHIMAHGERFSFMGDAKRLASRLALPIKDGLGEDYMNRPDQGTGPIAPGGSNFQNKHLVFRQDSITVKFTWKLLLFLSIFLDIGIIFLLIGLFDGEKGLSAPLLFGIIWSSIFLLIFILVMTNCKFPFFDLVDGMFYPKGFTRDGSGIPLKQLDHLEIVKERVYNKNSSYDSYELNVALKDGSRYNIMDHGADKLLLADAKQLAEKLSLPLINADTAQPITHEEIKLHKELSAPMTAGGAVFLIIFGLMFFGAGSLAAWMVCLKPMSGVIASGNWTPTPARIVSSHLDRSRGPKGGSNYRINIQYQYDINGSHYTSNRYDFFRSDMSSNVGVGTMRKIVSDMTAGKETTCLVNPANPTEAVISRSIPWFFALFMLFPLPFLFIGGMTIFTAIKSLVKPTKK
ncbi:MAG: DUF3592 domain-containing protein [Victivallales bacterium]|nr:DUF3592 domain-containing protein [Victivallales bacterium]